MTCFFTCLCEGSEATKQTPGRVEKHVILNEVKNPTTKVKSICSILFRWDISLALNMTYFFYLSLRQCQESKLPGGWKNTSF